MLVTMRLLGPFTSNPSESSNQLKLSQGATVEDAVRALGAQLGAGWDRSVLDHLEQMISLVLVNGCALTGQIWTTELRDGDVVSLVAPMAGG